MITSISIDMNPVDVDVSNRPTVVMVASINIDRGFMRTAIHCG